MVQSPSAKMPSTEDFMEMEQITIAGHAYNVPVRYEEGHELTAGEASALNQTFHENIRNNLAKKAKEGTLTQGEVDQYAQGYQFGVRTPGTGGVTRDPVQSEAMRIAKRQVSDLIRKSGKKVSDYEATAINSAAQALIQRDPAILDLARQRVAEQQSLAQNDLGDILAGLTEKPAQPQPTAEHQPQEAPHTAHHAGGEAA
jgi:hypothetical protein